MLGFFYRYRRSCLLTGAISLTGAVLFADPGVPAVYGLCLLFAVVAGAFGSLYSLGVTNAYTEKCDPEPYLEAALWDIRRYRRARLAWGRAALAEARLRAASALGALGRYREALEELDAADRFVLPPYSRTVYWQDRFSVLLWLGQAPDELARLLAMAEESLEEPGFPFARRRRAEERLQYLRTLLLLREKGPVRGAVTELERALASSTMEYERVGCHMSLARLALALEDREAALEHLNYVLAHGNKLYARTQAEELLAALPPGRNG